MRFVFSPPAVEATGLLSLPWTEPLEDWKDERLVEIRLHGISRHVVRFASDNGVLYALKSISERLGRREYRLLRSLAELGIPAVEVVGVAVDLGPDADAILVTKFLPFAATYRAVFSRPRGGGPPADKLLDALVELLVRLHLSGFFWGDCSLSNSLFRYDAGALVAYLVDTETSEQHPELTTGQRRYDVELAVERVYGELLDLQAGDLLPAAVDPLEVAQELQRRYEGLWDELTREEIIPPDRQRLQIAERLRRLNELGFDAEEVELIAAPTGSRLRVRTRVAEPAQLSRELFLRTGLDVGENQARRLLNDIASFRAYLEQKEGRPVSEVIAASRWLTEVYDPVVAAIPADLRGRLAPAEIFHEILEHRWYMSERAGRDVGTTAAVRSYFERVLPQAPEPLEGGSSDLASAGSRTRFPAHPLAVPVAPPHARYATFAQPPAERIRQPMRRRLPAFQRQARQAGNVPYLGTPWGLVRNMRRWWRAAGVVVTVSFLAACSAIPGVAYGNRTTTARARPARTTHSRRAVPTATTRAPSTATSIVTDTAPGTLTAAVARALFASSPVVVVSGTGTAATAARAARDAHAPLLLASPPAAKDAAQVAASVRALRPKTVLAEGLPTAAARELAAKLPGVRVVSSPSALPATGTPVPHGHVAVLLKAPSSGTADMSVAADASLAAVTATAKAAGAAVISMTGTDPRTDPAAVEELARLRPDAVVAVGAPFGPASQLASRVAVAETGRQLPGGGQVLFPGRRLVALYGHPGTPALGVLGHQDLAASITRARKRAAAYRPLSHVPVVPAFEIIATVAEGSPGRDGTYSYETPVSQLLPWVRTATADGLYVVLDLQPGRASLLTQAKHYQSLLELPDVGLALDAEWKLQPGQVPLQQIGHVNISEVNSVARWLAALTARYHLPQKLLVLHQFRLSMLTGERGLDTGHDDLAIVIHMDGQGTPAMKQTTWNSVTAAAPSGVFFGWKNFLVKDHPMLTPGETMTKKPTPVMISYQ